MGQYKKAVLLEEIRRRAIAYRKMEQDCTPRLYRGKVLHDLGTALSELFEADSTLVT
jgi:hypothetical protein